MKRSATDLNLTYVRLSSTVPGLRYFTLLEVMIAGALLSLIIATISPLMITMSRSYMISSTKAEFESNIHTAQGWIKRDMASSSRSEFLMQPADRETDLEAISLPTNPTVSAEGIEDWGRTVVYHMHHPASGDGPSELRRTVFDRRVELSLEGRRSQMETVYENGNGNGARNGNNASTQTLLHNVQDYLISSDKGAIDAYAPGFNTVEYHNIGTWIIEPGYNNYTFEVTGINEKSSSRTIGIDQILVSDTGMPIDAESLLPALRSRNAYASSKSMAEYSGWSNNAELYFPAAGNGDYFTIEIYNDTWLESTFVDKEDEFGNPVLKHTQVTYSPDIGENVCRLIGLVPAWEAQVQSLNDVSYNDPANYNKHNIRVLVSGREDLLGKNIMHPGQKAKVTFQAGGSELTVRDAFIMEHNAEYNGAAGTVTRLQFDGDDRIRLSPGQSATSDYADLPIDPEKDYVVSYYIEGELDEPQQASAWDDDLGRINSYTYKEFDEEGNLITPNIAGEADWGEHGGEIAGLDRIVGVEEIIISYPEQGSYTSPVVDTGLAAPSYKDIKWQYYGTAETGIKLRVRAADDKKELKNTSNWDEVFHKGDGINSLSALNGRRYIQWQAELISDTYDETPELRNVAVRWEGRRRAVDIALGVSKGPDRGVFQLLVNEKGPQPSQLRLQFRLGRKIDNQNYSREFSVDVSPRN